MARADTRQGARASSSLPLSHSGLTSRVDPNPGMRYKETLGQRPRRRVRRSAHRTDATAPVCHTREREACEHTVFPREQLSSPTHQV